MKNWKNVLVRAETSLTDAINVIDGGGGQIAVVTDSSNQLLGVITDADIRKAILRNIDLKEPCARFMTTNPHTLPQDSSKHERLVAMGRLHIRQVVIVDKKNCVTDVSLLMDLLAQPKLSNPIVIMAGGLGTRLAPLTNDCPKPLLKVGEKPLLQTIVEQAATQGFQNFYLSVNYRSEMIRTHFGDGSEWDVSVKYLVEEERKGTAGSLSLLPADIKDDIVVMNGDLLTKIDFEKMLRFHKASQVSATMAVKDYEMNVPYGVVDIDVQSLITGFREKPAYRFFVNAGVYILSPECLKKIPRDKAFDMPMLFDVLRNEGLRTGAFPLREYWMDIGVPQDFERANSDYGTEFVSG